MKFILPDIISCLRLGDGVGVEYVPCSLKAEVDVSEQERKWQIDTLKNMHITASV